MRSSKYNTAKEYDNVDILKEVKSALNKDSGVTYIPCIVHNLIYFMNCFTQEQCSCYDFCNRFSSTDILR
jgi:hypothetical protein